MTFGKGQVAASDADGCESDPITGRGLPTPLIDARTLVLPAHVRDMAPKDMKSPEAVPSVGTATGQILTGDARR